MCDELFIEIPIVCWYFYDFHRDDTRGFAINSENSYYDLVSIAFIIEDLWRQLDPLFRY